jgi:hypothetical protein
MTGFPIIFRGFSLRKASQIARYAIFHSQTAVFLGFAGKFLGGAVGAWGTGVVCVVIIVDFL